MIAQEIIIAINIVSIILLTAITPLMIMAVATHHYPYFKTGYCYLIKRVVPVYALGGFLFLAVYL